MGEIVHFIHLPFDVHAIFSKKLTSQISRIKAVFGHMIELDQSPPLGPVLLRRAIPVGPSVPSAEDFVRLLQSLSTSEEEDANVGDALDALINLTSRARYRVPPHYLEPLLNFIDPVDERPAPLVNSALRLVRDLVVDPHYVDFFAQPQALAALWGWTSALPSSYVCLQTILEKKPGVINFLLENGLREELADIALNPSDFSLDFLSSCLKYRADIFDGEIIENLIAQAPPIVIHRINPSVIDSYLVVLAELINRFPECLQRLTDQIPEYPELNTNDITAGNLLTVFNMIVMTTQSFEVIAVPTVCGFFAGILRGASPWKRAALELLNAQACVTPLVGLGGLLTAVIEIMIGDYSFEERRLALQCTIAVAIQGGDALRRQILTAGVLECIALFLEVMSTKAQVKALQFLAACKETYADVEFGEALTEAMERLGGDASEEVLALLAHLCG
jgi:hypothetical protein